MEDIEEHDCLCEIVKTNFANLNDNKSSLYNDNKNLNESDYTSSEEENYFEDLVVDLKAQEFYELRNRVSHPLVTMKSIINLWDGRMGKDEIDSMKRELIFSAEDYDSVFNFKKKSPFFLSLPYSYFPLRKKPISSKDSICAPLYMNEREVEKFCALPLVHNNNYKDGEYGMAFEYNFNDFQNDFKKAKQTNWIFHQQLFFDKILKERLTNKTSYGKNAEYELPLTVYEPITFLKRFCDFFAYIKFGFEEIFKSEYNEETIIRKLFSSLFCGFHFPMASQGVPLRPIIGETYEIDSEDNELKLFAEVKHDNPIHIVYNIRWKKRKAVLDGSCKLKFDYNEPMDEMRVKIGGMNTLLLKFDNFREPKIFTFNLPLRVSFKGTVDPIGNLFERHMSIDSFIYFKGENKSAILGLNRKWHGDIFYAFYGMIGYTITNYQEDLTNGHTFFGVVFHNSGFSMEDTNDSDILQSFIVNPSRKIENINKLMEMKTRNDRILQNGFEENTKDGYLEGSKKDGIIFWWMFLKEEKDIEEALEMLAVDKEKQKIMLDFYKLHNIYPKPEKKDPKNLKKRPQGNNNNNKNNNNFNNNNDNTKRHLKYESFNPVINDKSKSNLTGINYDNSNLNFLNKKNDKDQNDNFNNKDNNNNYNNDNKNEAYDEDYDINELKDEEELLEVKEELEPNVFIKYNRRNKNPYEIYNRLFKRIIREIAVMALKRKFVGSFNMHFIYKIYVGSWVHLNFFEISYHTNEMCEFYVKYKMGYVHARPLSDFNKKKNKLCVAWFDNNFFRIYNEIYGKLWKTVKNPLVTDTRFREDLLWLMRFYEIVNDYPENETNPNKLDEYENIRLTAFLNAGKWKELLETFSRIKISKRLNK
jgi:hypothetical protein